MALLSFEISTELKRTDVIRAKSRGYIEDDLMENDLKSFLEHWKMF